ncbi:acyltransferase [Candidatus Peregrinibacteria bacterium CG10_big_fil_rev_8_21_14_0_10_55_24]|nr:MAG: acyltransferase [Candidatus Peregrinibacteria bacterium CG10_big_fil_rev_8_21_14_0_10_55_24]
MMGKRVIIGLVQMACDHDVAANLARAQQMIAEAADKGAKIVALPELFASPYFCQNPKNNDAFAYAQRIPGAITNRLAEIAKKYSIVLVGGSLFEKTAEGSYYNTATVFGPDGAMLGTYRKTHIPHDPAFYEQDYFAPGDTGIRVFETPYGTIGVLICYDQWFPEAARIATLQGAEIIFYPTAIATSPDIAPVDASIPEDWETMWRAAQVGHAAVNNVYVAAINRVGTEGNMRFWGGSFVADPNARLLIKADDTPQIVLAEVDLSYPKKMQQSWRFLMERRPETYGEITQKRT